MKKIEAVIFDMDGVISNTVPLHFKTGKKIADKLGIEFTKEWNQKLQGIGRRETIENIVSHSAYKLTSDQIDELCDERNQHYQQLIKELTASDAQPGIRSFIEQLHELKIPMVIASASQNASKILRRLELIQYFDGVVDVTTLKKGKPDPEIFLRAAELVKANPACCVAIEDGEPGLTAILQTDMFSVGVGEEETVKRAQLHVSSTSLLTVDRLEEALNQQQLTLF